MQQEQRSGLGLDGFYLDVQCTSVPVSACESVRVGCPLSCPVILRGTAVRLAVEDRRYRYTVGVSQPLAEPSHLPPATEQQVRSHAVELVDLAARHGITHLAFASPGRLRGHVGADRDLFDMFEFQRAATDLLGAEITVYSDGALANDHVSPDLAAATPL